MGLERYEEFVRRSKSTLVYDPGWSRGDEEPEGAKTGPKRRTSDKRTPSPAPSPLPTPARGGPLIGDLPAASFNACAPQTWDNVR